MSSFEPGTIWNPREGDPDCHIRIAHVIDDESGVWAVYQDFNIHGRYSRPQVKTVSWLVKNYTPQNTKD